MEVMVPTYSIDCPETTTNLSMALVSWAMYLSFFHSLSGTGLKGPSTRHLCPLNHPQALV